ncbi:hypothetical protein KJ671_02110 [Patescibacteria group bacterium]|nr:hypothetical protein [Patescibacteria group bacterium]
MNLENIKKKFENKQNLTFYILSTLMFVLVFLCAYYSISYLAIKTHEGLNGDDNVNTTSVKFDIEKIAELKERKIQN